MFVPSVGGKSPMKDITEAVFVPRVGGKRHMKGRIGRVCTQGGSIKSHER